VSDAIGRVISLDRMRYFALSHVEADECGAMNDFLAVAPNAVPLCGRIAAMVSMTDLADRQPRAMSDGELNLPGNHTLKWFDTAPHAARLGMWTDVRHDDANLPLRRSVHSAGQGGGARDRVGRLRTE
jgi:hypothetical protein